MISGVHDTKQKSDNYLTIILDDGDEIIKSIEKSFKENNVKKAILMAADGSVRDARVALTKAGTLKQRQYGESIKIKSVSGEFIKVNEDYYGDVHISLAKDAIHTITGILLSGHADGEVEVKFKIISDLDYCAENREKTMVKERIIKETVKGPPKPIIEA